jgi:hypothetical protein
MIEKNTLVKYSYYIGPIGFFGALIIFRLELVNRETALITAATCSFMASLGLLADFAPKILRQIQKLFEVENPLSKWILGGASAAAFGLTLLLPARKIAGNMINNLTHENPIHFTNSQNILTGLTAIGIILFFCFSLILILITLSILALSILSIIRMFGLRTKKLENIKLLETLGKGQGALTLAGVLFFIFIKLLTFYDYVPQLLVMADYYSQSPCANQRPSELVAFIGNDQISVAIPTDTGSYRFERRKCENALNK